MKVIVFSILIHFAFVVVFVVPFFSTPLGEQLYANYQDTKLHKAIYCQYVEWFGASGFDKLKFVVKCKIPDMVE
jgi:hypothetical protein